MIRHILLGGGGVAGAGAGAGADGADGADGVDGDSAYDLAVTNGFVGTEVEWLASLVGADGVDSANSTVVVFQSTVERDAATPYVDMITLQVDTGLYTQYVESAWVAYTGVVPFYHTGAVDATTVEPVLADGYVYWETL